MVLIPKEDWKKEKHSSYYTKEEEYRTALGSSIDLQIKKYEDEKIRVTPKKNIAENLESDFSLVAEAAEALYSKYGEFTLFLPVFEVDVIIKSSENVEKVIIEEIIKAIKNGHVDLF